MCIFQIISSVSDSKENKKFKLTKNNFAMKGLKIEWKRVNGSMKSPSGNTNTFLWTKISSQDRFTLKLWQSRVECMKIMSFIAGCTTRRLYWQNYFEYVALLLWRPRIASLRTRPLMATSSQRFVSTVLWFKEVERRVFCSCVTVSRLWIGFLVIISESISKYSRHLVWILCHQMPPQLITL
jgi:hypothetical protein